MNPNPPQTLPPSGLPRLLAEARQCRERNDYAQAIQILQRANRMDPSSDLILIELGYSHALAFDFAAAESCFEQALRLAKSPTDALLAIGHHWMDVRRFQKSCESFEKILQQPHIPLVTFIRLGELYLRLGRREDAAAIGEKVMFHYGAHEGAMLTRAKVHRQLRELEAAEKMLREIVAKTDCNTEAKASAWYELGTVLDQQARYDEAMTAFMEAKTLLRQGSAKAFAMLQSRIAAMKRMEQSITAPIIERWRKFAETQLQPTRKVAWLCGYPRSGTTLLEYVLDSHPQIVSADETQVFQNKTYVHIGRSASPNTSLVSVMESVSARNLRQIRTEYFRGIDSFLGQNVGERFLIDKNPGLTFDIPTICRIFPEAKFLIALRDPRDVCLSCFMQASPVLPDTAAWLSLEGTISNYASTMALWSALKPAIGPAGIEVRYEDMVENLEASARRLLDFFGFDWDPRVLSFHEHARTKTISSPTYAEVTKPIFKTAMGRWRNYQKYFEPHAEKFAPFLKTFGYE